MPSARVAGHPVANTLEYKCWTEMKQRCYNPKACGYEYYGGKGIKVCAEWLDSFHEFFEHIGPMPSDEHRTVDRFDNSKNYEPGNVRWATKKEQQQNKSNTHYLTFKGKTQNIMEWAKEVGLEYNTIRGRIAKHGWTVEEALTMPSNWGYGARRIKRDTCPRCGGLYRQSGKQRSYCAHCNNERAKARQKVANAKQS